MTSQLDIFAGPAPIETDAGTEVRERLIRAGVWRPPDCIGDVAVFRVGTHGGQLTVWIRYLRDAGRSSVLAVAVHELVGLARIELEPR